MSAVRVSLREKGVDLNIILCAQFDRMLGLPS